MGLIQRLSDLPIAEGVAALVYGATGVGKTFFTATCGDRTLHLDLENRRSTIQSKLIQDKFHYNPIYKVFIEEPLPEGGAKVLDELTRYLRNEAYDMRGDYDTVVLDGVTSLRRMAVNKGLELNLGTGKSQTITKMGEIKIKNPIVPGQSGDRIVPNELGFVNMEVNDYTAEMQLVGKFLFHLTDYCRSEGKHCIVTAHRRVFFEKAKGIDPDVPTISSITPGFTGKTFPDEVIGLFDLIWYFETTGSGENTTYRARTVGDSSLIAKTCYPGVFKTLESNPNFQDILKRIKEAGHVTKAKQGEQK